MISHSGKRLSYFLLVLIAFNTLVAQSQAPETTVWVNTKSSVYHCPGSKWYGNTELGLYMKEDQARDEGYNAAGGHQCKSGSADSPSLGSKCGIERWPVKILADKDKSRLDFRPLVSNVKSLSALPAPSSGYEYDKRIAEAELHVYRIRARLLRVREEADSDIHLIIADPDSQKATMIAEIPAPFCALGSGHEDAFAKAREIVRQAPIGSMVDIDGVGFFDVIHGQRGRAPNGIELHPVLSLRVEP